MKRWITDLNYASDYGLTLSAIISGWRLRWLYFYHDSQVLTANISASNTKTWTGYSQGLNLCTLINLLTISCQGLYLNYVPISPLAMYLPTHLHLVGVRVDGVPLLQFRDLIFHVEAGADPRLAALMEVVVRRLMNRNKSVKWENTWRASTSELQYSLLFEFRSGRIIKWG